MRALPLRSLLVSATATIALAACGSDASSDNVPTDDVGSVDATDASNDAENDAGSSDAGGSDAGTADAGGADAGGTDTGAADAATDTPGVDTIEDTGGDFAGVITINEVAAAGDPDDWFELANGGETDVDVSGWTFTDSIADEPGRASFPEASIVPAGGYLLVQFEGEFPGFGLAGDEELGVHDADGNLVDGVDWNEGDSPDGASLGRIPNFDGDWRTLFTPTPGEANVENDDLCGNGTLDDGEACDDGATVAGDGCDPLCVIEGGYACDGEPSSCVPVCGDGQVVGDEQCDDGNTEDGDGCSSECVPDGQICGDGTVDPGEGCDDGNTDDDDGCSDACRVEGSTATIVLNEIAAAGDPEDWIELTNVASFPVSLEGWTLQDDDPSRDWAFPALVVAPGAFVSFESGAEGSFDFGLGRGGDACNLFDEDGDLVDSYAWGDDESPEGGSVARIPDGTGTWTTVSPATRDASND